MVINSIMNYLFSLSSYYTNYSLANVNNYSNFFYLVMQKLTDPQRKEFIQLMRITCGNTITDNFKMYIFKKLPDSDLLLYF